MRACADLHARERKKENTSCVESCGRVKMIYVADALRGLGVYRALEAMPCQQAGTACFGPASGALLFPRSFSKCRRSTVLTRSQGGGGQRTHARTPVSLWTIGSLLFPFSAREPRTDLLCLELWTRAAGGRNTHTHCHARTHTQVSCSGLDRILNH